MIAINWFEVLLPSTVFEIPAERLEDTVPVPKRKKSIEYRTVLRSTDAIRILYHVTASPPDGTEMEEVNFADDPSIAKYVIEHGFAAQLQEASFEVWLRHVGGVGYRSVDSSARPHIYRSMEGIKFRCFYGFDRGEPPRWGLILSYATRQYFNLSLTDTRLRQLALGKQVVPLYVDCDETADEDSSDIGQRSGILESVRRQEAVLIDRDGNKHTVSLDKWTLPCRLDNLLGYIRSVEGPNSASEVATKLQQEKLTLTSERRMNTTLARDQLEKLRALMDENDLFGFRLPLPGKPAARVSQKPLVVGA
jgi:hypothetical protein